MRFGAQAARVHAWSDGAFAALEPLLGERRRSGRIRECHGDLHCANVVRWRGRLVPFDAIEFDPALRCIDVANDLAFLTMDLAARGRPDLRMAVLNAWAESLGDYAALPLLPYYETYRAVVRAKVAALRAGQVQRDTASNLVAESAVERYLGWAASRIERRIPGLVLTCGLSGFGQDVARAPAGRPMRCNARAFGRGTQATCGADGACRLAVAAGRGHLHPRIQLENLHASRSNARRPACRRANTSSSTQQTSVATSVASCCKSPRGRVRARRSCSARRRSRSLRSRIAARRSAGADASEADVSLLDRQPAYWEPLTDDERGIAVVVDAAQPRSAEVAIERLRSDARERLSGFSRRLAFPPTRCMAGGRAPLRRYCR